MLEVNKIYLGDNLELLKQLEPNSIHSCVSDFPYNLGFMGKKWDTITNYYDWCKLRAEGIYKALKPGGYCLIFGGTRTHHRLVCAFEDAGFEIRDEIQWIYGSGFPKSMDISKAIDKKAGAEREIVGIKPGHEEFANRKSKGDTVFKGGMEGFDRPWLHDEEKRQMYHMQTAPSTDEAKQWDGWGTALKPAHEPIMVARKPLSEKTVIDNVLKWDVGGININDSRIEFSENDDPRIGKNYKHNAKAGLENGSHKDNASGQEQLLHNPQGRFPANIIFDEEAGQLLDEQSGTLKSGKNATRKNPDAKGYHGNWGTGQEMTTYGDSGGASRFFYCAKANKKDRTENNQIENNHPTVKPTDLIKYLIRLVTPKNGICLDVCEGSGTHIKACLQLTKEDYPVQYIGFENEKESFNISINRESLNNII